MNELEYRAYVEHAWSLSSSQVRSLGQLAYCFGLAGRLEPPAEITLQSYEAGELTGHASWRFKEDRKKSCGFGDIADLSAILEHWLDIQEHLQSGNA